MIYPKAIYTLWLREMKTFARSKARVLGTLMVPLLFLGFLSAGFRGTTIPGMPEGVDYIHFLVPGMIGMGMLFTSTFAGMAVIWDRETGFLKEVMVAPVNRFSLVLGRLAGGTTTATFQGIAILLISYTLGFKMADIVSFLLAVVFMMLIAVSFIGLGLVFASQMKDHQGFGMIMNFIIFPLFFLSGAIYPVENLPEAVRIFSYIDPLTYGVDGLRGVLIDASSFPVIYDFFALLGFSVGMILIGAYAFEKSEYL
jgi:ABC-2 type transport system permease protein